VDTLYEKLDKFPSDLEELYARIVQKIPPSKRYETFNYLQLFLNEEEDIPHRPRSLLAMDLAIQPTKIALDFPVVALTTKDKIVQLLPCETDFARPMPGIHQPSYLGPVMEQR
jgi:hypothetical protein